MLIAITADQGSLEARVDPRLGRCPYYLFFDTEGETIEAVPNPHADLNGGAGIQAAQMLVDRGVRQVMTGQCGPNAYQVFAAAGIDVIAGCSGPVREVLDKHRGGGIESVKGPTVPGHHGMPLELGSVNAVDSSGGLFSGGGGGGMGRGAGMGRGQGQGRGLGTGMGRGGGRGMGMRGAGKGRGMGGGVGQAMPPNFQAAGGGAWKSDPQVGLGGGRAAASESASTTGPVAWVDASRCRGCGVCMDACPSDAIRMSNGHAIVQPDLCTGCGACVDACPTGAIQLRG